MAITNHERVGKALDLLNAGLRPFVERELKATCKERWTEAAESKQKNERAIVIRINKTPHFFAGKCQLWRPGTILALR
jgi:Swt1-like HEPN